MKVERVSRKFIKPVTPTPQNLKNYKLSFLDKAVGRAQFAVVLFYESKPRNNSLLEESLENALVDFYPLAGRYTINDHMIDCSDEGAVFVEAEALEAELTMDLVVKNMEVEMLRHLIPDPYFQADAPNPLLWIQVTHFQSGGVAIAVAVSHTVFDAFSLGTFIAAWSNATNYPERKAEITPSFHLSSMIPCKDQDFGFGITADEGGNIVVKRLAFGKEALMSLRSKLSNGKTISRVRVVCAVIAKALIGMDRVKHGKTRDLMIIQAINMRERTNTPSHKHACGNLVVGSATRLIAASEAKEIGLQELVDLIGDAAVKSIADIAEILSPDQDGRDIIHNASKNFVKELCNPDMNVMNFSDWSKFRFYEADFGFGKPVWTGIEMQRWRSSTIFLTRNKEGDGIEAWLHLNREDMRFFEQDEEIKLFTT